jgi:hypothetical protein
VSLLDSALALAGADPAQFKALFGAHLRIDFRRARVGTSAMRQRELSVRGRMILNFLVYMAMSLMVGSTAFVATNPRTYAAVVLGYALTMLGMLILMEFGVTAVQTEDLTVLGARPVSAATYTLAKVANLAAYVGFYGLAVTLIPLGMAPLVPGGGPAFAAWLAVAVVLGVLALAGLILALYGAVLRRLNLERARDLLNWLTILVSALVAATWLFTSRWMDRQGLTQLTLSLDQRPWMAWLPPVWFAGAVEAALGARDRLTLALAAAAGGTLLAGAAGWAWVARRGVLRLEGGAVPGSATEEGGILTSGRDRLAWLRPLVGAAAAWGGFRLLLTYMKRDRGTRARLYPQFAMSLAFFLICALQAHPDPWAGGKTGTLAFLAVFHPAMTCAWIPLLLRFSEQWEAGWVFAVAPGATMGDMARALQRAVLVAVILPSFAATWAFFAALWGFPGHALLHTLPAYLGTLALMDVALLWRKPVPLACRYIKGEAGTRMAITFTLMGAFTALGFLQDRLAGNASMTWLLVGGLLLAVLVLDRLLGAVLGRRAIVLADL